MNQATLAFGTDASVLSGYAQTANDRLGNVSFLVQNTGDIALFFQVRSYDGVTSPSGYANIGAGVTVNARGVQTLNYNLLSKRVGFFGSGVAAQITIPSNATGVMGTSVYRSWVTADVSVVMPNKGDLRGAQIDITATGRKGWSYDQAFNLPDLKKKWGTLDANGNVIPGNESWNQ